jgi:cell division protease FtsH
MRVLAGPEKKTRLLSEEERLITAYHEMGHALVGHFLPNCDPVHKISVVSRGQALGYTISLPTEDKFLVTRASLNDQLAMTLGGRAAEELVFNEITTGASNDIEKVTATSKAMVMKYGMSEKLGPRALGHDQGNPFLGRSFGAEADYSQEIAREIDDEIRRIIEEAHERARVMLTEHMDSLHRLSKILLDRETIDRSQFLKLLDGVPEDEIWVAEVTQDSTPETPAGTPERSSGRPRMPGFPLPAPPDAPPAGA